MKKEEQIFETVLENIYSLWKKRSTWGRWEGSGEKSRKIRKLSGISSPCPIWALDTVMIGLYECCQCHCMQANCEIFTSPTACLPFPQSSPLDHSQAVKHFHLRSASHLCGGGAGRKKRWSGRSQAWALCWTWPYTAAIAPETHSSQDALLICTHYRGRWGRGELSFAFACIIEKLRPEETQQFMREKLYLLLVLQYSKNKNPNFLDFHSGDLFIAAEVSSDKC